MRARLLISQGNVPGRLEAYLECCHARVAGQMGVGETDLERWREGVREVEDTYDMLINYGPKVEALRGQSGSIRHRVSCGDLWVGLRISKMSPSGHDW
jgi:hypothetical protein